MSAFWQIVVVILLAALVGAGIPVLIQLRRTLKRAEEVLRTTGPKLDRTLEEAAEAAERINRLGQGLEKDVAGLRVLSDAAAGLGRSLGQVRESVRTVSAVSSAVGPAIVAGLRALFSAGFDPERPSARRKRTLEDADEREQGSSSFDPPEAGPGGPGRRSEH